MAEPTVKATYSLDPETVDTLARLAARSAPALKSRLQAFRELQSSLRISAAEADRWIADVREVRAAWRPARRARRK